ncbi:hypothetical protein [Pantoea ananatis]|uniref:hypothetical protein n=1 Tax=Pantoea ananas TaxID=553 RepID=UPI000E23ABFF|nr:hypothetical protein [Pantoea ananatis]REE77902.1 hypothetical protein C7424_0923 [Pantoea ananatis]BBL31220.1 hypothetical protein PAFU01_26680 [Pantoea ananatis]
MELYEMREIAFMASTVHACGPIFWVGSAVSEEIKPDDQRLVVMVNEKGDRLATKKPGENWDVDVPMVVAQFPNIPKSKYAIKIDLRPLENK